MILALRDGEITKAEGRILSGKMDAFNDFGKAPAVEVREFTDFEAKNGELHVKMPACAVAQIRL